SIFLNHLDNPSVNGIVVNTRDISDRKMAELKERVYHDNLIFLSNSALDLLSLADRDDIYTYIAERLYKFLGNSVIVVSSYNEESGLFKTEKVEGVDPHQLELEKFFGELPTQLEFDSKAIESVINQPGVILAYTDSLDEIEIFFDGQKVVLGSLLRAIEVNKIYNIVLARDNKLLGNISIITLSKSIIKFKHIIETFVHQVAVALHRNHLENELVQAKERAEESDRLKTAFLANLSHEIRTPMNGILGFAEMLDDDTLNDNNRKKYIDIINTNGKVLISLIDDIIDFAKIEAGQLKILEHDFSLNTLLNQIHASFISQVQNKERMNVELHLVKKLEDDKSYIKTDPTRLRQIMTNLIGNALKFTNKGFVEFGYDVVHKNAFIQFYVKDTGIGIEPRKLDHIFERFVQADSSSTRKYSGSGLGLAISKGFVNLLGGEIWVDSEVNVGSTFYFTIPFVAAEKVTKDEEEDKKPKKSYNWEGITILIAEDDLFSYKFLEGFISQTQAKVIHAKDGQEAVDICRQREEIDLILMDVQMPEMNGLDATRNIKGFWHDIPIIAQTANAIPEEKQKCFEAGFDDFITKPINISNLFIIVDKWLQKNK
ncbi:MAG: ATP-binding protein, partial [Bacteroidales bacterium]|nr:ATP-binding protein [Bacteroidales bacterium]